MCHRHLAHRTCPVSHDEYHGRMTGMTVLLPVGFKIQNPILIKNLLTVILSQPQGAGNLTQLRLN